MRDPHLGAVSEMINEAAEPSDVTKSGIRIKLHYFWIAMPVVDLWGIHVQIKPSTGLRRSIAKSIIHHVS